MKKLIILAFAASALVVNAAEVGGNFKSKVKVNGVVANVAVGNMNKQDIAVGSLNDGN